MRVCVCLQSSISLITASAPVSIPTQPLSYMNVPVTSV